MDMEKLRGLTSMGNDALVKRILQLCNPKDIACELTERLTARAEAVAKEGQRSAAVSFTIYERIMTVYDTELTLDGPLGGTDWGNGTRGPVPENVCRVLLNMVQEYIRDNNIILELSLYDGSGKGGDPVFRTGSIKATLTW